MICETLLESGKPKILAVRYLHSACSQATVMLLAETSPDTHYGKISDCHFFSPVTKRAKLARSCWRGNCRKRIPDLERDDISRRLDLASRTPLILSRRVKETARKVCRANRGRTKEESFRMGFSFFRFLFLSRPPVRCSQAIIQLQRAI
jgi:hypothetical protein